jgi:4'-phosphopantetheinyl transferase
MKVYALNISGLCEKVPLSGWLEALPADGAGEVMDYTRQEDRLRVLGGKLMLANVLQREKTGCHIGMVRATDKGRLFIEETDLDFNISHSGNYVVLATSWNGRIGVDVEMVRQVDINMFRRLFTDGEWEAITGAEDPQEVFFKSWAVKESIIKADGRGVEVLSRTEILSEHHAYCDGTPWYFRPLAIDEGYSGAVAFNRPFAALTGIAELEVSDLEQLLSPQ